MTEAAPGPEILPLIAPPKVQRLLSLDVFRGVTIFAMLIVNNLYATPSGYFWKHADWIEPWPRQAYSQWRKALNSGNLTFISAFTQFPLFKHCTLADYVMPWFMLIIGLAIPYSAASMESKGLSPLVMWRRLLKRAAMLVLLGWILCYFRDQFSDYLHNPIATFHISLGMDVLQLLGVAYLLARILYELPPFPRLTIACVLFIWHWAFLRYLPQGDIAAGTFAESAGHQFSAAQYAYDHWPVFQTFTLIPGRLTMNWIGLLSVPPAAATMLLGTLAGDFLRRPDLRDTVKAHDLAWLGALTAAVGLVWSFDLPFNKPRWTSCYLLYTTGVGFILISLLYYIIDIRKSRKWIHPFVVFGANSLAVYWLSIMGKILLLNTPRITPHTSNPMSLTTYLVSSLQHTFGTWLGGWIFTSLFIAFWWFILDQMYRRKLFWKL